MSVTKTFKNLTSQYGKIAAVLLSVAVLTAGVIFTQNVFAASFPAKPNPAKLVNDFAGMLTASQISSLETKLRAYNDSTTNQIAIVTVNSIGQYAISDFALNVGRQWGIGQSGKDNGILVLIAKDEKEIDIEVGTRMDVRVTDTDALHVINQQIVPSFKNKNYYSGLNAAVDKLISVIAAHPL